ncbi:hypothetical protein BDN71DRAFT_1437349 [Pleurotus eryngii]|uniref:Uncharacterized protein n=1 Tax=Pleurotus eryngii TaxID=5323 RepID=A0A9P6D8K6_PLEER|nr:hypothetical protein BDN71DRAFT_1437349 [Pleurotus eryngii]
MICQHSLAVYTSPAIQDRLRNVKSPMLDCEMASRDEGDERGPGMEAEGSANDEAPLPTCPNILRGDEILGLFENNAEWQLARWLMKNVGHNQADEFLKLPIISQGANPSYCNKKKFIDKVDSLPSVIEWELEEFTLMGDLKLIGNPLFEYLMRYAPKQVYKDSQATSEVHSEMWTGKFEVFSEVAKKFMCYHTFHQCMSAVLASLEAAEWEGVKMVCADAFVHWIWPVFADYVANYPEQCLVTCCMENRCPICKVQPDKRGSHEAFHPQRKREMAVLLFKHELNTLSPEDKKEFSDLGLLLGQHYTL